MLYRVNAGSIPKTAWTASPDQGGGMLISEMCHFVDVFLYLTDSAPVGVYASCIRTESSATTNHDNLTLVVDFRDGSQGTLFYSTQGDKSVAKERLEVYSGGHMAILDDYRGLDHHFEGKKTSEKLGSQDKGQKSMVQSAMRYYVSGGPSPLPLEHIFRGMRVIFAAQESLSSGKRVELSL